MNKSLSDVITRLIITNYDIGLFFSQVEFEDVSFPEDARSFIIQDDKVLVNTDIALKSTEEALIDAFNAAKPISRNVETIDIKYILEDFILNDQTSNKTKFDVAINLAKHMTTASPLSTKELSSCIKVIKMLPSNHIAVLMKQIPSHKLNKYITQDLRAVAEEQMKIIFKI